ncbi:MAG TPA: hypothetical protein VNN80_21180 [Polyangiaceae bacterium]|jgi:hypothetical protein|nr:hypothetical protein [Polyangiaceae bacterium]
MAGSARFEAEKGWVAVSADGCVWCYRGRGSAGVLAFERDEEGRARYQATHQDCFSEDTSITTDSRRSAVRFAVGGSAAAGAARVGTAAPAAHAEGQRVPAPSNGTACELGPEPLADSIELSPRTGEAKAEILAALPGLSPADRREILARLLELEAERVPLGAPSR